MSISSTTKQPAVLRAPDRQELVRPDEFPPVRHFIDGTFRPGSAGQTLAVVDPSSGRTIAQVADGTAEDADTAGAAAAAAAPGWGRLTPKERSELLHRVADRLAGHAGLLARLESASTGKPPAVAQDDITQTVDTFRFMAGALRATTSAAAGRYAPDHLSVILREPLGVVGVVTPWNYPLLMAAWKIAPILAAGNTLVIKPAELTPLTTLKFAELVADILPPGTVNVVTGTGPVVDTPFGLAASVWTADAGRGHDVAAQLDFGTVWVNAHLVLASEVPWGGFKGSGYGRDLSSYALDDYSRTKHVMHSVAR